MKRQVENFVTGDNLRNMLTYFHDAVLVKNNASALSILKPGMPRQEGAGSDINRGGFQRFIEWIDDMNKLRKDDSAFDKIVLEPFKLAAGYCQGTGTVDIRALIFAISSERYWHKPSKSYQKTIALISPDLQAPFSMRINDDSLGNLRCGFYKIKHVRPTPLTNRLHQYGAAKFSEISESDGFEDWRFLSCPILDLDEFAYGIEAEHYCEVPIYDDRRNRILGAILTVSGKVEDVNGVTMTISAISTQKEAQFTATGAVIQDMDPTTFRGKYVKALVVIWHTGGHTSDGNKIGSQLFIAREVSKEDALNHEIVGHVRLRKSVPLQDVRTMFGDVDMDKIPGMLVRAGGVEILTNHSTAGMTECEYLQMSAKLHSLRKSCAIPKEGIIYSPKDVFDPEKISAKHLSKQGDVVRFLETLVRSQDYGIKQKQSEITADITRHKRTMLENNGYVKKNADAKYTCTKKGLDILYEYREERMADMVKDNDLITVPLGESVIPPTLFTHYLVRNGYHSIEHGGCTYGMVWKKGLGSNPLGTDEAVRSACNPVLQSLCEVTHQITVSLERGCMHVQEDGQQRTRLSRYALAKTLAYLRNAGVITQCGDSYLMPTESRIIFLMESNPDEYFDDKTLLERINIPRSHSGNSPVGMSEQGRNAALQDALSRLKEVGSVTEVIRGHWCLACSVDEIDVKRHRLLIHKVRGIILDLMNKNKKLSEERLAGSIDWTIRKQGMCRGEGWRYDPKEVVAAAIAELIKEGRLSCLDGSVWIRR